MVFFAVCGRWILYYLFSACGVVCEIIEDELKAMKERKRGKEVSDLDDSRSSTVECEIIN